MPECSTNSVLDRKRPKEYRRIGSQWAVRFARLVVSPGLKRDQAKPNVRKGVRFCRVSEGLKLTAGRGEPRRSVGIFFVHVRRPPQW